MFCVTIYTTGGTTQSYSIIKHTSTSRAYNGRLLNTN